MEYIPPFTISNKMLEYVSSIMEKVGKLNNFDNLDKMPILRRNNRIHSIHSSLAIEANHLTYKQVKDVINGKLVLGPEREIQEVKNAYSAYEMIEELNAYNIKDLLKIHNVMMKLIADDAGQFRLGAEGVFDEVGDCIFIAPKPEIVPTLMNDLFKWLKKNKDVIHPLILSSIFHYEFLFIHPFSDGNGRCARFWQNVILGEWKELFFYVPIETQIKKYQDDYYNVIDKCNKIGNSDTFIEFILDMINRVLDDLLKDTEKDINYVSSYVNRLIEVMEENKPMTALELMKKLKLKSRDSFRCNYLRPALEMGLIGMTNPLKPTSKNQRYYKI